MKKISNNQYRLIFSSKLNLPEYNDANKRTDIEIKENKTNTMQLGKTIDKNEDCGYKFWDEEIYD